MTRSGLVFDPVMRKSILSPRVLVQLTTRVYPEVWRGPRGHEAQASVRDSARVSAEASCCTSGTTMFRWSFSKDCFIWEVNTDVGGGTVRVTESSDSLQRVMCRTNRSTHLVEECDGGLQDLLPLTELRLVKLPLQVQHLSPLSCRLRQRAAEKKKRNTPPSSELSSHRGGTARSPRGPRLPVGDGVGVPLLQCVSRSFQSVQLVEQQHVESHEHHQTDGWRRREEASHNQTHRAEQRKV